MSPRINVRRFPERDSRPGVRSQSRLAAHTINHNGPRRRNSGVWRAPIKHATHNSQVVAQSLRVSKCLHLGGNFGPSRL